MIIHEIEAQLDERRAADQAEADAERQAEGSVNHASELGWLVDCPRHMVLSRMMPERDIKRDGFADVATEGRIQEGIFRAEMLAAGVNIVRKLDADGNQEYDAFGFPANGAPKMHLINLELKGQADDVLEREPGGRLAPIDYKSCSDQMFRKIRNMKTSADLAEAKEIWLRHYVAQMFGYMALYDSPIGVLAFRNKQNGKKHFIEVAWTSEGRDLLEKLKEINVMVETMQAPPAEWCAACEKCGFVDACFEKRGVVEVGEVVVDDIELKEALDRRAALEAAAKEYEKIDEEVKARFADQDGLWRAGDWTIENHPYSMTVYKVPDDIKKKYAEKTMRNKIKIRSIGL